MNTETREHEHLRRWDDWLSPLMVVLGLLFLVVTAVLLQWARHASPVPVPGHTSLDVEIHLPRLLWLLCGLWPLFGLELLVVWLAADRSRGFWRRNWRKLLVVVIPPLRIGSRCYSDSKMVWIPVLGFQRVDEGLRDRLERAFSLPMVVVAILILPVLGIEFGLAAQVEGSYWLGLVVDSGTSLIWFAFALEFIVLGSVAHNGLHHLKKNWVDLLVVLLPLVAFLRAARLVRLTKLGRLQQLTKLGRTYRLRGTLAKLFRALVVFEVVKRWQMRKPEKRLARLEALLAEALEEVEEIQEEIQHVQSILAEERGAAVVVAETSQPEVLEVPQPEANPQ